MAIVLCPYIARSADREPPPDFHKQIKPILTKYCYDCHGYGERNGNVALDELKTDDDLQHNPDLWFKVLRNVRSGIMPPKKHDRPNGDQRQLLAKWIKYVGLGINPDDPDPGRVTLRRLNRIEYRNTILDLTGYDYKANEEFPTDDTGYGFDTIGDVLTVSELLLEKYLKAAEAIVGATVPTEPTSIDDRTFAPTDFKDGEGKPLPPRASFYRGTRGSLDVDAPHKGHYNVELEFTVRGQFQFDPAKVRITFKGDDRELLNEEFGWQPNKKFQFDFPVEWDAGKHELALHVELTSEAGKKVNDIDFEFNGLKIRGPTEKEFRVPTKNYDRFFSRPKPPTDVDERRAYAREVVRKFANKAYRRPVEAASIDRLVQLAETEYTHPGKTFEDGVRRAMVAVLASPRFLFRVEEVDAAYADEAHPFLDDWSLASRLSYFLWSTMPDDELCKLAEKGKLRAKLPEQIERMIADRRSDALVQNFVGQWLQIRDIEGIAIDEQGVLAREDEELSKLLKHAKEATDDIARRAFFREIRRRLQNKVMLDGDLRGAMQQEVELMFGYILRNNRSVCDLIGSDYTFLNERLATHYGIPDVKGPEMRRVELPKGSPRGGVLTSGAVLAVTSNPDRTSAVKRGLFVLDNMLGAAPPPPPAGVPALEESAKHFKDKDPTLRELLQMHRNKPLCSSCHSRMDPVGLGFDNFNALGMWREKEKGQPIDSAGELITGEKFASVQELKHILATVHRTDFYRCLTEKLMIYALGRGLTYDDVESVDRIVDRLESDDGKMLTLVGGIVESPEFLKRRRQVSRDSVGQKE
jgi:hypothetical protein